MSKKKEIEIVMEPDQQRIDLEASMGEMEKKLNEDFPGLIIGIEGTTNHKFFGTDNSMYGERDGYAIKIRLNSDKGEEFTEFFGKPDVRGLKQSNMWAFRQKYGHYPKVGMGIACHLDENGFFRVTK